MRKKFYITILFWLFFYLILSHQCFAKYTINHTLQISLEMDKTPPIIHITTDGEKESFNKTQTDVIKKTNDITIDTSDNVKIDYNEYDYNPNDSNFDGTEAHKFQNGQKLTQEGYYKIVAVDTSGNKTEIIILLDKSAPIVNVTYLKKTKSSANLKLHNTRQTAGIRRYMATENLVNTIEDEKTEESPLEEIDEIMEEVQQQTEETRKEEKDQIEKIQEEEMIEKDTQEVEKDRVENEAIIEEEAIEMNDTQLAQENIMEENQLIDEQLVEITNTESIEINTASENEIMPLAIGDMYVGNEAEFRNALANQAAMIHIRQSIDFTAPLYINYGVTIVAESAENALRYGNGGSFITVQSGGSLTIAGIVIDTNSSGNYGITAVNIESGGYVTLADSAIIDGGLGNIGILVNGGGSLLLWSCEIVRCSHGINLQTNGNLYFATQQGRCNNFYWNGTAIFIDNFFGTCNLNQNICMHDNSIYGIYIANSCGAINISAGTYYNNKYGIHTRHITGGKVNISGGDYYANEWAIWCGGSLTLSGGTIHNNYYGVYTEESYSGMFQMTGGNIYSNTSYAIYHTKTNDGGCRIIGGNVSGPIYLARNDNYINTDSSYPTFKVTPSSYYFKRKLVKTTNNAIANSEISNITVTPKDAWYKYVNDEYIVLWSGGNVIIRCKDYDGNILKQEVINGSIGTSYTITAPNILGYDVINIPSNIKGIYTQSDIIVDFQYDFVNCAKVTFEDLLSGIVSARYWYNANSENFGGNGADFTNGMIFENYGYYKVIVTNGVGLEKEFIFTLNKDSVKR